MGMPTIQGLYGNLEEHELEQRRYKRNGDDKMKKTLALKASNSFDNDDEKLDENELKKVENKMAFLSNCKEF